MEFTEKNFTENRIYYHRIYWKKTLVKMENSEKYFFKNFKPEFYEKKLLSQEFSEKVEFTITGIYWKSKFISILI